MKRDYYNFFNEVKNPFLNNIHLMKSVYAFANSDINSFQDRLLSSQDSIMKHQDILEKNSMDYFMFLFQEWRKFILSISFQHFLLLKNKGIIEDDFLLLQKKLSSMNDISSIKDIYQDASLIPYYQKYGFFPKRDGKWQIASTNFINPSPKDKNIFFCINSKNYDTFKICRLFHKKCIKKRIPCYYQFQINSDIIDNIIIFSDEKHITDYAEILDDIKREFPHLISRCGKTSPVTGKTKSFFGVGATQSKSLKSYYENRAQHIQNSIHIILWNYIQENYHKEFKSHDLLIDYLAKSVLDCYIREVNLAFLNPQSKYRQASKEYRFLLHDINQETFYKEALPKVKRQLFHLFRSGCFSNNLADIHFSYHIGWEKSKHTISSQTIQQAVRNKAFDIFQANPVLYQQLARYLAISADSYGISNNYYSNQIYYHSLGYSKRK